MKERGIGLRAGAGMVACCLVAGCSVATADGGPFSGPDREGDGTGTLRVEARIEASPDGGERADGDDDFDSRFEIDVRDAGGADVGDAVVVVASRFGEVVLEQGGGCARRWCGSQRGYARTYTLEVRRGGDFLDGVRLTGPEPHHLSAPEPGAEVDAALPLEVRWAPAGDADSVRLETREVDRTLAGDPGTATLEAGVLRTRDDRPEDERVRVERRAIVSLSGALPGSELQVSIRNGVELFTAVTP
jgi:hypothetical protein